MSNMSATTALSHGLSNRCSFELQGQKKNEEIGCVSEGKQMQSHLARRWYSHPAAVLTPVRAYPRLALHSVLSCHPPAVKVDLSHQTAVG